jgi:hypothetical protein
MTENADLKSLFVSGDGRIVFLAFLGYCSSGFQADGETIRWWQCGNKWTSKTFHP